MIQAACFPQSNIDRVFPLKKVFSRILEENLREKILRAVRKGEGIEIILKRPILLPGGKKRIGGQAGNSARALGMLGAKVFLSVPKGRIAIARLAGKNVKAIGSGGLPREHLILEYSRNFSGSGGENRIILTFDPENAKGVLPKGFEKKISEKNLQIAIVGGAPLSKKTALLAKCLLERGTFVHYEFNSRDGLGESGEISKMKGSCNSFGCNLQEARKICKGVNWSRILSLTGAKIAIVHGEEESRTFFRQGEFAPEKIVRALVFAGKVSAGKVFSGRDCSEKELGLFEIEGNISLKGAGEISEKYGIVAVKVPSWNSRKKKTLVGLGDSFAAGFCLDFVRP